MDELEKRKRKHPISAVQANGEEAQEKKRKQLKTDKTSEGPQWRKIQAENLDLDYCILLDTDESEIVLRKCEQEVTYNTGRLAQVRLFGKWIDIPRQQVAYGDPGLSYAFSGNTVPACPWPPFLAELRDRLCTLTGHPFNFVLVNRYSSGNDYMGEHKDDEKDLEANAPIASLSLGQARDFYFKHQDRRGAGNKQHKNDKGAKKTKLKDSNETQTQGNKDRVTLVLETGSLLMMNPPTNKYWYHALPKRKSVTGARINLTFRCMKKITKEINRRE